MTANRSNIEHHQVMVVLGQPDLALIEGLRSIGLAPIAEDGDVVVWGRRLQPPPTPLSPPPPEPAATTPPGLLMTIADAATALGLGRSTVYEFIGRRQLEVVHVGRSARVPTEALRALVERLRADQADNDWRRKAG
jgi:excisionase family DNA binding protein